MGTRYYGLPEVDEDSTLSFVDSVNGLATATDAVLSGIQYGFDKPTYKLPTATSERLGGVRIGSGFKVYSDGLLTTEKDRFTLKPATKDEIGGVAIGKNITNDGGAIGIGNGAFGDIEANEKTLALGGVGTDKIQNYAVTEAKVNASLLNRMRGPAQLWANAQKTNINLKSVLGQINFDVYVLSNRVKIVLVNHIYTLWAFTKGEAIALTTTQGQFGTGVCIVQVANLNEATTGTLSIDSAATLKVDFNANTLTWLDSTEDRPSNFENDFFNTPGIVITA